MAVTSAVWGHANKGIAMKSKWSMQTQTQRNVASTPVMPIPAAEIFPPNNNQELQQRALSMIHEFSAHIGSPGLFIAIRTPARSKKLTTGSLRADWGDFWDRGRGIAFARRFSSRTQRSIEFGYFGDKQKLAVFADMAERVWRTAVPLSWQRLLPHGNSNGSNSARDDFALSLFCQPARFMEELPLNWRGEGAYAELVADMNLGKLLDVVGCLCDSPERETATIERLLQGFSSRPDYLYIAISGDVFHAAVEYLQHLAIYWADAERGIFSEEPIPRNELEPPVPRPGTRVKHPTAR